jgi:chemotaxis protein methyltransferase CheR
VLADGGYLLLGHSESLWQISDGFELVEHDRAYCYRKAPAGVASSFLPAEAAAKPRRQVDARSGPSAAEDYESCLQSFRAEEWSSVEASLEQLIRSCPTFVPAHLLLGGVHAHRGRYDEAVEQAHSVLQLSDLEPRAHLLLGMIASRRGRSDEALQSLRRALYLDDSLALAHFWLGNLYRDRGDIDRACHEYENVVRDWQRHTLDLPEEFASELTAEQLVAFCCDSLRRLRPNG